MRPLMIVQLTMMKITMMKIMTITTIMMIMMILVIVTGMFHIVRWKPMRPRMIVLLPPLMV